MRFYRGVVNGSWKFRSSVFISTRNHQNWWKNVICSDFWSFDRELRRPSTSRLFYTDTLWLCENREKLEIRVSVSNIWHVARTKHAFKTHTDTQDSEYRENLLGTLSVFPSTPSARDQRLVNKPGREANCMFEPRWRWRCKENLGCFGRFSHPQSTSEQKI